MPLTPGSRLGPYEIEAALGEGGMGRVYRARDTRLGRTVAIKVLHGSLAADPAFARRFENEARTLSRIAHPNICVLHDVGIGDPTYLVLEHLEGAALVDRIQNGPLPFDEVNRLGVEICRALETAHKAGIVHRDLKPANVMLTRSGAKLLDFGIALEQRAPGHDLTTAVALTVPGTIVGTVAYMAPEQLHGAEASTRSDIFALGAVLYEAATGRRAFAGDSPAAVTSAILTTDPQPPSALRPDLPAAFDLIVAGCLARDPEERWQSAHDVARQLETIRPHSGVHAPAPGSAPRASSWIAWSAAGLALAAAIGTGVWASRAAAVSVAPPATIALTVPLAAGTLSIDTVEGNAIALSPDGSQLAWIAVNADTSTQIWLRPLSQIEARALPGTRGAHALFWSPDSRSIAFFGGGLLQRLDLQRAAPVVLCKVQSGSGYTGTWGADGQILFASIQGEAVLRVSTAGGTPERVLVLDRTKGERRIGWPWFLPDGRSALYTVRRQGEPDARLMLMRADGSTQHVGTVPTEAQFVAPGYVVFVRLGALLAQRFDPASGRLSGEPLPLASNIQNFPPSGWAGFSAARNGTIAFLTSDRGAHLAWIDASGRATGQLGSTGNYLDVGATADGANILTSRMDNASGVYDIWSIDAARGTETRVTAGPSTNISPVLVPGGAAMIYSKTNGGAPALYRRDLSGGADTELAPSAGFQQAVSVTRDGATLLYLQRHERGDWDIFTLPLKGPRVPVPLIATTANEFDARLSPDERVFAFVSDDTGHPEIYVAPFPAATPRRRVSTSGGRLPRWSSARTLLFVADDRRVMRADVTPDGSLSPGSPAPLFAQRLELAWRDFLPLPGGRLLAIVPDSLPQSQPMTVITNAVR